MGRPTVREVLTHGTICSRGGQMALWAFRARSVIAAGVAVVALGGAPVAQDASDLLPPRVARNVEGEGSFRSVIHSVRRWRGQNNAITTETLDCDVSAQFHGDGD